MRRADVPPAILKKLNRGEIEAVTLAEVLSVDLAQLMKHAFPKARPETVKAMQQAADTGWLGRTKLAGELLLRDLGAGILDDMAAHPSDQVRGWGAALIAAQPRLSLKKRLSLVRPLADDPNPGVREVAWIMIRPFVAAEIGDGALDLLLPWTEKDSANLRRYAVEITRPRGVWCAHLPQFRRDPRPALPLLDAVRADPSRYVQNAAANWLNDASKDNPDFTRKVTARWTRESKAKETAYICRRALRTLNKKDIKEAAESKKHGRK